jgi:hypothetical protein
MDCLAGAKSLNCLAAKQLEWQLRIESLARATTALERSPIYEQQTLVKEGLDE